MTYRLGCVMCRRWCNPAAAGHYPVLGPDLNPTAAVLYPKMGYFHGKHLDKDETCVGMLYVRRTGAKGRRGVGRINSPRETQTHGKYHDRRAKGNQGRQNTFRGIFEGGTDEKGRAEQGVKRVD